MFSERISIKNTKICLSIHLNIFCNKESPMFKCYNTKCTNDLMIIRNIAAISIQSYVNEMERSTEKHIKIKKNASECSIYNYKHMYSTVRKMWSFYFKLGVCILI